MADQKVDSELQNKVAEMEEVTKRIFGDSQIEVKYTPSQGRHVITQRDLKTAEVVLTSDPYTVIVNEVTISNVCAHCFTFRGNDIDHDVVCTKCNEAWYCNDKCKDAHYEQIHSYECAYMKAIKERTMSSKFTKSKLRSLIRLLIKRYLEKEAEQKAKEEGKPMPVITGPKFIDVESLIAHNEDNEDLTEENEILDALKEIVDKKYIPDDDKFIIMLMSRSECNQFGLWSPEDELLGLSLHPSASFFNHSCIPNCYSEWSGINLVFRTLYPVPAGTELTISYIDAHNSTRQRKEELQNAYYFTCICQRCSKTGSLYPRSFYDSFYQRYLRCPKGPGLMRLDSYQGEEEEDSGTASGEESSASSTAKNEESNGNNTEVKKKSKKKKKKRTNTVDGWELPKQVPVGYEIRSCMTCSVMRCSPIVPSLQDYLKMYNIYEPEKFISEEE